MSDVTPQGFPGEHSEGCQSSGKKCRRKITENDKRQGNIEEKRERNYRKSPSTCLDKEFSFFLRNIPTHLHLNVVSDSILWPLWLVNQFVEIKGKCVYRNSCTISLPETWAEFSISIIGKMAYWTSPRICITADIFFLLFLTISGVSQNIFCGNQTFIICY